MANDKKDDRKPETPDDVAALYAWANLQNVKYRDFSANRREHRVQQQMQRPVVTRSEVAPTVRTPAPVAKPAPRRAPSLPGRLGDPYSVPEHRSLEDSKRPAPSFEWPVSRPVGNWNGGSPSASGRINLNAEAENITPADGQTQDRSGNVLRPMNRGNAMPQAAPVPARVVTRQPAADRSVDARPVPKETEQYAGETAEYQSQPVYTQPAYTQPPPNYTESVAEYAQPAPVYARAPQQTQRAPVQEPTRVPVEAPVSWRYSDGMPEDAEQTAEPTNEYAPPEDRPAWLYQESPMRQSQPQTQAQPQSQPPAPDTLDTLIDTRERVASRWFALRGVFNAAPEQTVRQQDFRPPVTAVFSLAGGVGKTSMVATLGRALSGAGERVLLADTTSYGLMPFYYGARELRPGVVRTFTPPRSTGDSPVNMVSYDADTHTVENDQDGLLTDISEAGRSSNRIIVDLATASSAVAKRILRMAPTVLVPIVPDMSSVIGLMAVEQFFRNNRDAEGNLIQPYYILNQFDPAQPLHLDVREVLRQQLGERLLPIVLRRSQAVSEALAEGMTVMDYAPKSGIADDYASLANWLRNLQAPAQQTFRAMRWSEQ